MKYSHNWLQDYVEDNLPTPQKIEEALNLKAFEVEGIATSEYLIDGNLVIDTIYDIKVLPNRAHDALSHYYMAHEIAACLGLKKKFLTFDAANIPSNNEEIKKIKVNINAKESCSIFMSAYIENVSVGESPEIIKKRLEAIGQKSINNIVDITNYVQYSINKPMHAYDANIIEGSVNVRYASDGEELVTLDDKVLKLTQDDLVIADDKKSLGLAGIKGGKYSGISSATKNILIESANFDPVTVRKGTSRNNIKTDASKRFENGLSDTLVSDGLIMTVNLILENVKGSELVYIDDVKSVEVESAKTIDLKLSSVNATLGSNISDTELVEVLNRLSFEFKVDNNVYKIQIPDVRLDLESPIDIIEEVGRIYGFNKLVPTLPQLTRKPVINIKNNISNKIRNIMLGEGYSEVITYSLVKDGEVSILKAASDKNKLRKDISTGLIDAVNKNLMNMQLLDTSVIKMFEIGNTWHDGREALHFAFSIDDGKKKSNFNQDAETIINAIKNSIKVNSELEIEFKMTSTKPLAYECELNFSNEEAKVQQENVLVDYNKKRDKYKSFSMMPFIIRDIAFWTKSDEERDKCIEIIDNNAGELCISIKMFDTFSKDGRTSYAYRLIYQATDRTLTDEEVNKYSDVIYNKLKEIGVEIR